MLVGDEAHGGMTALSSWCVQACAQHVSSRLQRQDTDQHLSQHHSIAHRCLASAQHAHAAPRASRSGYGQAAQDGGCAARAVYGRRHNAARIAGALTRREQPRVAHALACLSVPHDSQLQHAQAAPSLGM